MAKFRKKPVEIEAMQWLAGAHPSVIQSWAALHGKTVWYEPGPNPVLTIPTLEGSMTAWPGDWIIKGIKGEFYPCKPDIFAATYDPVDPT